MTEQKRGVEGRIGEWIQMEGQGDGVWSVTEQGDKLEVFSFCVT